MTPAVGQPPRNLHPQKQLQSTQQQLRTACVKPQPSPKAASSRSTPKSPLPLECCGSTQLCGRRGLTPAVGQPPRNLHPQKQLQSTQQQPRTPRIKPQPSPKAASSHSTPN
ncbi:hypothetical protein BSZ32_18065 [Rubritalea profundi]|uniref:Uncharacterized protein n=1 Tax=Rubritalea profundi TaxID=1658618 RepID=A0A2S7U599_9BACT|nr:hypothetical protein BSZ32_18065 [Rubritalea profundi]